MREDPDLESRRSGFADSLHVFSSHFYKKLNERPPTGKEIQISTLPLMHSAATGRT